MMEKFYEKIATIVLDTYKVTGPYIPTHLIGLGSRYERMIDNGITLLSSDRKFNIENDVPRAALMSYTIPKIMERFCLTDTEGRKVYMVMEQRLMEMIELSCLNEG